MIKRHDIKWQNNNVVDAWVIGERKDEFIKIMQSYRYASQQYGTAGDAHFFPNPLPQNYPLMGTNQPLPLGYLDLLGDPLKFCLENTNVQALNVYHNKLRKILQSYRFRKTRIKL